MSECLYAVALRVYKRSALEKLSAAASHHVVACSLHNDRVAHDLLYALFSSSRDCALLARVLNSCYELASKKYAPNLAASRIHSDGRAYVMSDRACVDMKLFQLLFFLCTEEELQQMVLESYTTPEAKSSALTFMTVALKKITEPTLNWSWSRVTVAEMVREMVHAARKCYLTTSSPRTLK